MFYNQGEINIKQFYLKRISYIYVLIQYYTAIYEKDSI